MSESDVYYAGDKLFSDEQDCLAVVMDGEFRYRVYYYPMTQTYLVKVDGTVYDASNNQKGASL